MDEFEHRSWEVGRGDSGLAMRSRLVQVYLVRSVQAQRNSLRKREQYTYL